MLIHQKSNENYFFLFVFFTLEYLFHRWNVTSSSHTIATSEKMFLRVFIFICSDLYMYDLPYPLHSWSFPSYSIHKKYIQFEKILHKNHSVGKIPDRTLPESLKSSNLVSTIYYLIYPDNLDILLPPYNELFHYWNLYENKYVGRK